MGDSGSDREARLEALTAALIHRFNNVLMGIQPHVEVIKRAAKDNDRVLGSVSQIETALKRAKTAIAEVTRLAKPVSLDAQPLDVGAWFEMMQRELQPFVSAPVDLTFDPGDHGLVLSGDRDQLTLAIANLVTNAVEAMPNGGAISVKASSAAGGIELQVSDNGTGVSPDLLARVFEPLFTTKRNAGGMGLPVVQQIIEAHGGTVRIDSKAGEGTTVTIFLRRP